MKIKFLNNKNFSRTFLINLFHNILELIQISMR